MGDGGEGGLLRVCCTGGGLGGLAERLGGGRLGGGLGGLGLGGLGEGGLGGLGDGGGRGGDGGASPQHRVSTMCVSPSGCVRSSQGH